MDSRAKLLSLIRKRSRTYFGLLREQAKRLGGKFTLVPPRRLRRRVGPHKDAPELYEAMGLDYLAFLRETGGLASDCRVLDVGCGCGQMAAALTEFLRGGSYEGFDPDEDLIRWCQRTITPRFPSFCFQSVQVQKYDDANAECRSSDFAFPYGNEAFDWALVKSIFTHMFPDGIERYLAELVRVLRPGGRVLATYYLIDHDSLRLMESGASRWNSRDRMDRYRVLDKKNPLALVAHDESYVRDLYEKHGLRIEGPVFHGGWRKSEEGPMGQDCVVAVKA